MFLPKTDQEMRERLLQGCQIAFAHPDADAFYRRMIPKIQFCSAQNQSVVYELALDASMRNIAGIMHGGLIAVAFDHCAGILVKCCAERYVFTPTVSMSLNFHRPVVLDMPLYIEAQLLHSGRTLATVELQCWQTDKQKRNATGSATFFQPTSETASRNTAVVTADP